MQALTEETVGEYIAGNPSPIVILFYTKDSEDFPKQFEQYEEKYPQVQFYMADVTDPEDQLRVRYDITEAPAALLIISGNAVEKYMNKDGLSEEQMAELINYIETMTG